MAVYMGQYRFAGTASCTSRVSATKAYRDTSYDSDISEGASFKDIEIRADTALLRDRDYFVYLKIPQDVNYDLTFNIKLMKESPGQTEQYQFLRQVTINKGGTIANVHRVALYETLDEEIRAMIPHNYIPGVEGIYNDIYYDELNNEFYLCSGGTSYQKTYNYNDLLMAASWEREQGDLFAYAEIGFRPVEEGFSKIVIEMVRTAEDYNIQNNETGEVEYGRIVPIESFDFALYSVANLVETIRPDGGTLMRIGVSGHTGLMLMINGEEVRIGPSRAYELDVLDIVSLGVVAIKPEDLFTIDYAYEAE